MATMTQGSAAVKGSSGTRGVTVLRQNGNGLDVRIRTPRDNSAYRVSGVESDFGRGFLFENESGESYHVHLDGEDRSCECTGHLRHGHCKHADGILALIRCGGTCAGGSQAVPSPASATTALTTHGICAGGAPRQSHPQDEESHQRRPSGQGTPKRS
jgi:hypothetical protein